MKILRTRKVMKMIFRKKIKKEKKVNQKKNKKVDKVSILYDIRTGGQTGVDKRWTKDIEGGQHVNLSG